MLYILCKFSLDSICFLKIWPLRRGSFFTDLVSSTELFVVLAYSAFSFGWDWIRLPNLFEGCLCSAFRPWMPRICLLFDVLFVAELTMLDGGGPLLWSCTRFRPWGAVVLYSTCCILDLLVVSTIFLFLLILNCLLPSEISFWWEPSVYIKSFLADWITPPALLIFWTISESPPVF